MPFINYADRVINYKLVYFGAPGAGKGTTVRTISERIPPSLRGKLRAFHHQEFPIVALDYGDPKLTLNPFSNRIHLYTLPSNTIYHEATARLLLTGVDGIIFVADSQKARQEENSAAWANLQSIRILLGVTGSVPPLTKLPLVVQFTKRDLPKSERVAMKHAVNHFRIEGREAPVPHFGTSTVSGTKGFKDLQKPIDHLLGEILKRIKQGITP